MLSMSRCLVDDVEVYRSTRLRLISFTISYYFPFLFNPVACESCPHIFDFTPLPHNSYHTRSTSARLSPSINRDSIALGRLHKKQGRRRIETLQWKCQSNIVSTRMTW